ncbi:peptidoglycan hydrolase-like protein with peptidoglycan-binding domain [Nocardioides ginsengisegetis]|uniref:Peptidoglycan hydrolase-like protein with peptidoglycan-binding domain n=1 Tax=Nocardioides ginsengisegetis TaxID=661491 RepID=A0A7W3PB28_9ACTN|nr:peptidoglycan-binding protein [Nocardioides ginsengisegetis]MBA8805136.1 peptidoglycan hydrolase-like protein with peptidoglycan-binding domain [Nocardioides ginsengisegetis]
MRALRALFLTVLVSALLCGAAYGAGLAVKQYDAGRAGAAPVGHPAAVATPPASPLPSARPTPSVAPTPTLAPEPTPTLTPGPTLLGPGATGDEVRDLQARLVAIYWLYGDVTGTYDAATFEAVRGFQDKRGFPATGDVDRRTLDRLHEMTLTPTHAAMYNLGNQPGALDARCKVGRVLCIDKTSQTLRWVVDGTVLQTLDVRFGASYSPTREGLFHVYVKDADHVSHLYGSEMPYSMFFSRGQAVHYSSDFAARGYAGASHGCVNVRDHDGLARLFAQVRVGDAVVVYWS